MHQFLNEDVAFERLKDLQREAENRRLATAGSANDMGFAIRKLAGRVSTRLARARRRPVNA